MKFILRQACSTLPIVSSAFFIYNRKHISIIYKIACILSSLIAFFYHGFQIPCKYNGLNASYTLDQKNENNLFRTILRKIDLSLVCFLASFLGLQNYDINIERIWVVCMVSGCYQWSTTLLVCIMIIISIIQYIHLHIFKGMLLSILLGGLAFSYTPHNMWLQPLRYTWHISLALWVYGSGYIIHE